MDILSEVTIYHHDDEKNTTWETAKIKEDGDFVLEGCSAGEISEKFWGGDDYEYWLTVDKKWKDTILLLLAQERFKSFEDFRQWLDEQKIPNQFQNYI